MYLKYIRAIGFLYLRYSCDPALLFSWFQPYLFDEEPIQIKAGKKTFGGAASNNSTDSTIGEFARKLLSSKDYYGTLLPRLPLLIERDIQVKLLEAEKVQKRAETHFRDKRTMNQFQRLGSEVYATYEDEENPLAWYKAVVDRVIHRGDDGVAYKYPRFIVTFTEYGNTETVNLGEMDMPDGKFHKEDIRADSRGYDDNRHAGAQQDLYEEVRRRERESVTSSRKGGYSSRPPTAKQSLSAANYRKSSSSERRRSASPPHRSKRSPSELEVGAKTGGDRKQSPPPTSRKRTAEELAAIQEKKRKLMAKYG